MQFAFSHMYKRIVFLSTALKKLQFFWKKKPRYNWSLLHVNGHWYTQETNITQKIHDKWDRFLQLASI